MRALVVIVAVVVVLFVAAQLVVPPLLEARVGHGLEALAPGAPVHVQLSTFPAYRLLTGSVGRLDVHIEDLLVDGLRIAEFRLEARNVDVDVGRLWKGEPLPVIRGDRLAMELIVEEDALQDYIDAELSFPGPVAVEMSSEGLRLSGDVSLLNNVVPVVVTGRFEPAGSAEMLFVPDDVVVQGAALPAFMVAVLRESYTVRIDLNVGPLPVVVDEVAHESGRVVLRGSALRVPAASPRSRTGADVGSTAMANGGLPTMANGGPTTMANGGPTTGATSFAGAVLNGGRHR